MSLRNSFVKGVKWSFIQQGLTQLLNYISIFWLANLIAPEDFGRVALVVVFVGAFEAINGFGVSQLIIRDHITDKKIISTYFWLITGLSTALFLACLIGGFFYSFFFDFEDFIVFYSLVAVSSLSIPINGVNSVFSALYSRDLDFKFPARIFVFSLFIGNSLSIVSGYLGWGFWALLIKNLIPNVIISLCYWFHGRYKILLHFDRSQIKGTWNFSSNFTYFNALNYLIRNLDYVLIGRFFDLTTVGQYSIAYKIMLFPMKNITARIHTILYPVLVKMKDDIKRVERTYSIIVSGIAHLIFPLIVMVSALAHLWIPIIFDVERYDKLIVLVQVLSVVGAVQGITGPVMSLYLISGKTRTLFIIGFVIAVINSVGFIVGGINGDIYQFAMIYAVIQIVLSFPLSNYVPFRLMKFDFGDFIKKIFIPFVASLASYFIVVLVLPKIILPVYLKMTLSVGVGIISYLLVLLIFSGTKLLEQIKQIKSMIVNK